VHPPQDERGHPSQAYLQPGDPGYGKPAGDQSNLPGTEDERGLGASLLGAAGVSSSSKLEISLTIRVVSWVTSSAVAALWVLLAVCLQVPWQPTLANTRLRSGKRRRSTGTAIVDRKAVAAATEDHLQHLEAFMAAAKKRADVTTATIASTHIHVGSRIAIVTAAAATATAVTVAAAMAAGEATTAITATGDDLFTRRK
jgi:hypothetical protein